MKLLAGIFACIVLSCGAPLPPGNDVVKPGPATDPCCVPTDSPTEVPCSLKPGASCRAAQPCCDPHTCRPVAGRQVQCRGATDCRHAAYCDGHSAECPAGDPAPDNRPCRSGFCLNGSCSGSPCSLRNLQPCTCPQEADGCKVCCQLSDSTCVPASALGISASRHKEFVKTPGSPCADNRGWCTPHGRCELRTTAALTPAHDEWLSRNWKYLLVFVLLTLLVFVVMALVCLVLRDRHAPGVIPPSQDVGSERGDTYDRSPLKFKWPEEGIILENIDSREPSSEQRLRTDRPSDSLRRSDQNAI